MRPMLYPLNLSLAPGQALSSHCALTYFTDYCVIPNSIGFYIGSLCKSSDVRKLFLGRCHVHAAITVAPPLLGLGP